MISFHPGSATDPYRGSIASDFVAYPGSDPKVICQIMLNYSWSPIVWRGGRRVKEAFLAADYYALDFDKPYDADGAPVNLGTVSRYFCEHWFIIGATRSHQKSKGKDPPCDRFRLLLKAEETIKKASDYEYNLKALADEVGSDPACVDAARFFFPCTEILEVNVGEDLYAWQVDPAPAEENLSAMGAVYAARCRRAWQKGELPDFAKRFLGEVIPGNTLHAPRFRFACDMARCGVSPDEAMELMLASPSFRGKTITPNLMREYERVMRDGYKAVAAELKKKKTPA